mgnify:FL=1
MNQMVEYTGTDNLDVMADARNYNDYLLGLVMSYSSEDDKMLDFGAGIGTFASEVAKLRPNVLCVEPDVKQAQRISDLGLAVVSNLGLVEESSMDLIYSFNVLEHIKNDSDVLKELYSKLKEGGRILVYVPAFPVLYSSMDKKVGHYRRYKKSGLSHLMIDNGFCIEKARYVDSAGFVAALAYKFIGSKEGDISRFGLLIYDRFIFPLSRIMDVLTGSVFGKNVYVIAKKVTENER